MRGDQGAPVVEEVEAPKGEACSRRHLLRQRDVLVEVPHLGRDYRSLGEQEKVVAIDTKRDFVRKRKSG